MRGPVPVFKVGDKVTEYTAYTGVRRIGVVTKVEYYIDDRCYFVQYPGLADLEATYKVRNLRESFSRGHGRYVCYIRPYDTGDEDKLAVTDSKRELRYSWDSVVAKITTREQCEELKRIFEEIEKEYEDAEKQKND